MDRGNYGAPSILLFMCNLIFIGFFLEWPIGIMASLNWNSRLDEYHEELRVREDIENIFTLLHAQ